MTDERIAKLERDLEFSAGPVVVVQTELVRCLLGEYRRDHQDAARFRYCEHAAEPSDGNDAGPWWVLTVRGPTFAEAVDIAREQVTTDWSGHQGGA